MDRGQEEMVGFVLIVVVVAVILLVFLGLLLRQPKLESKESIDVSQFLDSIMEFTTDCSNGWDYRLNDLFEKCYFDDYICGSGERACKVLNETLKGVLDSSWRVGGESKYKGFIFNANLGINETNELLSIIKGNCTNLFGSEKLLKADEGTIVVSLKICY